MVLFKYGTFDYRKNKTYKELPNQKTYFSNSDKNY